MRGIRRERDMNGVQGNEPLESIRSQGRALPGQVVLVLQGGGALGSYQAGVYQALHEAGIEPDWIIGTSISVRSGVFRTPFPASTKCCPTGQRWQTAFPVSSDPIRSPMPARTVRSVPIAPDITPRNRSSGRLANSSISIW